jgi:mycothiol synthase
MPAKTTSNSLYNTRNYQSADFDKYVPFLAEAEKLDPTGRCVSRGAIAEQLKRPGYSPEQDLFILWSKDIVGYIDVKPELSIGRVVLDCWVHPEHRRRGLATKLLGDASNRARLLGARAAHVNIRDDNVVATEVVRRLGFRLIRRFLELGLDITDVGGLDMAQSVLGSRCIQPGEEDELTQLQNRAYAGSWGYNPNTVEEIAFHISSSTCSRQDIILTYDGYRAVGYCWTAIICEKGIPSAKKGRIHMVGVDPNYRGKGIGRELMMAGLARLRNRGLDVAELTVDSQNKVACALYESIGFKVWSASFWHEKVIH